MIVTMVVTYTYNDNIEIIDWSIQFPFSASPLLSTQH